MRSRGEILSVHRISYSYFQRIECIIKGAFKLQGNEKTRTVAFSCSCHQQLLTIKVTVEGIPVLLVTKKTIPHYCSCCGPCSSRIFISVRWHSPLAHSTLLANRKCLFAPTRRRSKNFPESITEKVECR